MSLVEFQLNYYRLENKVQMDLALNLRGMQALISSSEKIKPWDRLKKRATSVHQGFIPEKYGIVATSELKYREIIGYHLWLDKTIPFRN